ncbi:hypothetical protein HMPREF0204_11613 [Chryseobacterium gleum ATCC 35910]|uniref:Uncharacterized protein n=1 Tax=Chryseobacterium gleum ATCC 35910 TaxID=525257 RepID=A0ABN0ATW1_CHRGE|nr:hypothetical protein HMPREF0204_11613 [Chryseobacterium gleum ATCC 35910]
MIFRTRTIYKTTPNQKLIRGKYLKIIVLMEQQINIGITKM